MATVDLTKDNFESTIMDNDMVFVDFWASWCQPCKTFAPTYEEVSEDYPDIVFGKVDTENEQELAGHFGIRSIPTLMLFREQVIIFQESGVLPREGLESIIQQARDLDMDQVRKDIEEQQKQQGGEG
ncbi:thioredoxin [Thiohalorhabdus denitrificans]|uniref:Thioredoxin n=1 Tax=Thiohalorhabdus denitrificans TaxID=381306 RepID=A0A0P9C7L3_9GAMM|nr:thioredoxin [Thiohalorhabdus denitrificans]SCX75344.1 thioredoxin [Thiohalorhabdus denitrificans]